MWEPVDVLEFDVSVLRAPKGPPIRRCETLAPASITGAPNDGRYLVDFGQNLTGRVRLSTDGMGSTVTIRHAEVLEHGELCTRPLRTADATDVVTFGHGRQSYEPRYTLHGFRYAEVRGLPGPLHPSAIEAVACHTDLERVGWFSCSNELVNRLHENVVWGIRSNFVGVPTDCPQRDERLGWTGDIQIIAPTASFLYNCTGMLTSWLEDLQAEQDSHGLVPLVVPDVLGYCAPMAAWGDAAVIVPMTLFERTGDVDILRRQFNSMSAWVDGLVTFRGDRLIWDDGWQLGDWLDPSAPSDNAAAGKTDRTLVAAAYFVRSAALVSKAAKILGMHEQALRYGDVASRVRHAFQREFVTPVGRVASDSQTAYAMAIAFDLLEPDQCIMAGQRLADLVRDAHSHIGTGFIGAPLLCDALCTTGHTESAYGILLQTTCPSFLYPVTMGATTMWERWDALLPDGSVNPGKMTSFNHYAFGAIADWLHRTVAGLAPGSPGYRRIDVRPQPGGHLNSASATHDTPYGTAAVAWERHRRRFHLSVDVPTGSVADILLPDGTARGVGPGSHSFVCEFRAPEDDPEEEPSKLDRWLDPA
jgi:alpha-L-rhamnosidase